MLTSIYKKKQERKLHTLLEQVKETKKEEPKKWKKMPLSPNQGTHTHTHIYLLVVLSGKKKKIRQQNIQIAEWLKQHQTCRSLFCMRLNFLMCFCSHRSSGQWLTPFDWPHPNAYSGVGKKQPKAEVCAAPLSKTKLSGQSALQKSSLQGGMAFNIG